MNISTPHSHQLRKGRYSHEKQIYLVTSCTLNREPVFQDFNAALLVSRTFKNLDHRGLTQTYAYVVMPDHIHWLFSLEQVALGDVISRMKTWTSHQLGKPIWQKNYYDRALRKGEDIRSISRYIVANPLRANIVDHIGDYPHWDAVWITGEM